MASRNRATVERIILQARIWRWDMSWSFSMVIAASRLVALEINAEPLRYRKAKVMGIHLSTELEPDW